MNSFLDKQSGLLLTDLEEIFSSLSIMNLEFFRNKKILLIGGTGYVGSWLYWALADISNRKKLNLKFIITSRDAEKAKKGFGEETDYLRYLFCDFTSLGTKNIFENLDFDVAFIGASIASSRSKTDSGSVLPTTNALKLLLSQRNFAENHRTIVSIGSGAIYRESHGTKCSLSESSQIREISFSQETYLRDKLWTEKILENTNLSTTRIIKLRLFSFYGPLFPITDDFLFAYFMKCWINNQKAIITGNLDSVRTFMYPTDMVIRILSAVMNPTITTMNVGSSQEVTVANLSKYFSSKTGNLDVAYQVNDSPLSCYIPDTTISESILGLNEVVDLRTGISRWKNWLDYSRDDD